jgi:peptide/nickel transport system substrate-binding protein
MRNMLWRLLMVITVVTMLLSGLTSCAGVSTQLATPSPAPAATQALSPTQAPAAPKPPTPTAAPQAGPKSVTLTFFQEPDTLNVFYTQMWFAWAAIDLFEVGMWSVDDQLNLNLEMAAELPTMENGGISEDGTVITVKIRPEANWSDGVPVTAHDFVFTYNMVMADTNSFQTRYPYEDYIETMTALDDKTVQVKMTEPFVTWTTGFFRDVLPKHILEPVFEAEGTIDNAGWNRAPTVGNGPFVFKSWEAASHIVFEANPNYWNGRPKLDQIFIRIVPDDEAQMAALLAGDSDLGAFMTAADKPTIDGTKNLELVTVNSPWIESWFFNLDARTGHPALQDLRVRQAIVMALDRQQIIDELFYGLYKIPKTFWYDTVYEDSSIEPLPYDPESAKTLLDEAGWVDSNGDGTRDKDGQELVLRYSTTSGNELREATQVVVQQILAEVGIGAKLQNYSSDIIWNTYGDDGPIAIGEYDIAQWSDGAYDYPDPTVPYFLCSEIPSDDYPDGSNWYGICDPELDELFQTQSVTLDQQERIKLFYGIERIMHDQLLWVGLRTDPDIWAVNKRLKDLRLSGGDCLWNAHQWDISQ